MNQGSRDVAVRDGAIGHAEQQESDRRERHRIGGTHLEEQPHQRPRQDELARLAPRPYVSADVLT